MVVYLLFLLCGMSILFLALPEVGHVFEGLSLGLGYETPYEEGGYEADDAI